MAQRYVYVSNEEYFDSTSLKNPIPVLDHKLKLSFPEFYRAHYDIRLLAAKAPTSQEREFPIYNDYRDRYGIPSISSLDGVIASKQPKTVFLNGFNQEQFSYIAPQIKDTTQVLFLFKCSRIKDLSVLSQFKKLQCVHIFWNNTLESLWDMRENTQLKVISFLSISKLKNIEALKDSTVEYVCFDSSDNCGNRKPILFNPSVFDQIPQIKHLTLIYKECFIDL